MSRTLRTVLLGLLGMAVVHESAIAQRRGGGGGGGASASTQSRGAARTSVSPSATAHPQTAGGTAGTKNVNKTANANVNQNVNRTTNANVNQNVNVNKNTNVNVNHDVDVNVHHSYGYGGACCYHPVAAVAVTTAAVATTAAVIGSMVNTIPPSCAPVNVNGYTYQQCGSTWYQPQFVGTSTTYVVVAPPR